MNKLKQMIKVARGEEAPDLVLKKGKILCVFTREILEADVAICKDKIVGIGDYSGPIYVDCYGKYILPGFIEGHFHIESTLLMPSELVKAVIPHGTTAIVCDPHEMANVIGIRAISYILKSTVDLPLDFYIQLPSCVPATTLETSGGRIGVHDFLALLDNPKIIGLAEMMNFPGVISANPHVLEKIALFKNRIKDGHAPLLKGRDLNAYLAAGISSDHECTRFEEAQEKMRRGMHIFIREGSQAKNLCDLFHLINETTVNQCSLVTDDLHPHDLLLKGHLDYLVNRVVDLGLDLKMAVSMVTLNPARYFNLRSKGAVAPSYDADILICSSLNPLIVETVVKNGKIVYHQGDLTVRVDNPSVPSSMWAMNVKPFDVGAFSIPARGKKIRVIEVIPNQILTRGTIMEAAVKSGFAIQDPERDVLKVAVIERHHGTGNIGVGFVKGFGLKKGAIASTVAHDSHNLVVLGAEDSDMFAAAKHVESIAGGLAVAVNGKIIADLPLPILGLISDRSLQEVASSWEKLRKITHDLGCGIEEPFMQLSFIALSVIPELKISDLGLVDVNESTIVSPFVD